MSQENQTPIDPRGEPRLKLPEPDVSAEEPWGDDVLERAQIAAKLTNLIRDQSAPFAISIHGYWGTGKTFMLKRWQKDLEIQGFKAIYFNAWEDDFCDDPLLAIIGQLSEYFEEGNLKTVAHRVVEIAIPLLRKNLFGVLNKTTGLSFDIEQEEPSGTNLLQEYLEQRASKDDLKQHLEELSAKVAEESNHPLVFIIDELDRCRPTFAIELLERVKHIFDVPNTVFVFGINRDELCKSFSSIYGDIDVDVYLRRFFDMEFMLPEVDSEIFGRHLMQKYELNRFFSALDENVIGPVYTREFGVLSANFPAIWGRLGFSLRDIDYCVRSIALVCKSQGRHYSMYPWLLGLLIPLKLKNPSLYQRFIQGNCLGSKVMDYIDEVTSPQIIDDNSARTLNRIEAYLYRAELGNGDFESKTPTALGQLRLLKNGEALNHPEYLSKRTQVGGGQRADGLIGEIESARGWMLPGNVVSYLAGLVDLHQGIVRR